MTRLRIFVFPERPDALLIHVSEDHEGPLSLPSLPFPFTAQDTAKACGDAGIKATVRESVPGRWTYALEKAKKDDEAERSQKGRLEHALRASIMRGSIDQSERDRAAIMRQKIVVDGEIADLKKKVGAAKASLITKGVYMNPVDFRRLEARLEAAKINSQALQAQLGELKKREKEQNAAEHAEREKAFERRFIALAKESLDAETFADLVDAARADVEDDGDDD